MSRTVKRAIKTRNRNYRYLKANPEDTGRTIAWVGLIGAVGYGIWKWVTPEPPDGWPKSDIRTISLSILGIEEWPKADIKGITLSVISEAVWPKADIAGISLSVIAPTGFILTALQSPAIGWITRVPDKSRYSYGEVVTLTSYMDNWAIGSYRFNYWVKDGEWVSPSPQITTPIFGDCTLIAHYTVI